MGEKIKPFLKGKGGRMIVLLGLAGMVMILLSEGLFQGKKTDTKITSEDAGIFDGYTEELEERLEDTLEKIDGVGNADVMITASGSGEYVYAMDEKSESDGDRTARDGRYVIIGGSGDKHALIKRVCSPDITGVVVVCEGGESNVVREKVYKAVSAALGIPAGKIFVTAGG